MIGVEISYAQNSSLQYKEAMRFLMENIEDFKGKNLSVLDIGCAGGKITKEISLIN